ncbi:uncharacterized protein F54H12.2-like [Haliotis asinina]|uniref:uncharacterized protein F54H12.2-like n=1 Tax=Haliotis asinina TaxID=109174 RepID=UPI0035321A8B
MVNHKCGTNCDCKICKEPLEPNHQCYMTVIESAKQGEEEDGENNDEHKERQQRQFIVYDFECTQDEGGGRDCHKEQLVGRELPKCVVLVLVDNDAFAGSKYPFHFKHNNVTSLKLKRNGQEVHGTGIKSDLQNNSGLLKQLYMNLFRNTGHLWQEHPCNLTLDKFRNGFTLWAVDLTADLGADEGHNYPRQTGKLGHELQFAEPFPRPVTLPCYEDYKSVLEIDRFHNALMV